MEFRVNTHGEGRLKTLVCISTERGQEVASVLVMGRREAVLIDAQWTLANALRVTAEILETGLDLKAIYTTHAHPDHYFGIAHIAEYFPNARLLALPEVSRVVNRQFYDKLDYWEPKIGRNNVCTKTAQLEPLAEPYIELEGERIEILPNFMGDLKYNSVVHIPSIKTLYGSDVLFNQAHMFTCEIDAEGRRAWAADIDRLAAMDVDVYIPGHAKPGMPFDDAALKFTKDYLLATEEAIEMTHTAAEFYYYMWRRFPQANYLDSNEMNAEVYKGGRVWDWEET
ncbi:MAG: MBL fold metallo-hydrolase [Oscillospiraceae bacterium]|jgi:glyoxylase-like metal-dependent hydrolase (beta-lactamase superfamily II)|nr:MBL fold metallo-hydrolase [Oscillospiraceae bacterium]